MTSRGLPMHAPGAYQAGDPSRVGSICRQVLAADSEEAKALALLGVPFWPALPFTPIGPRSGRASAAGRRSASGDRVA
jgi:hypothetical protein